MRVESENWYKSNRNQEARLQHLSSASSTMFKVIIALALAASATAHCESRTLLIRFQPVLTYPDLLQTPSPRSS